MTHPTECSKLPPWRLAMFSPLPSPLTRLSPTQVFQWKHGDLPPREPCPSPRLKWHGSHPVRMRLLSVDEGVDHWECPDCGYSELHFLCSRCFSVVIYGPREEVPAFTCDQLCAQCGEDRDAGFDPVTFI